MALHRLWEAVWSEATARLVPVSPTQAQEYSCANTVQSCWDSFSYGRCFALSDNQWLWTEVWMNGEGTSALVQIDDVKQRALLAALPGFAKADTADWVSLDAAALLGGADPLPTLQAAAEQAVATAQALVPG